MKITEIPSILISIIIFTLIASFSFLLENRIEIIPQIFLFTSVIILLNVSSKKLIASLLNIEVKHELWTMQRFGFAKSQKLKVAIPAGIIFPLFITLMTQGITKFGAFLTYETNVSRTKVFKQVGPYRYGTITDWENGLIGATGICAVLILGTLAYLFPIAEFEYLAKLSIFYAFVNLIPFSKLDGTQIYFGSKTIWKILAFIATVLTFLFLYIPA
jgi:Zn-dependent protease